jgi:AcrR family transcriptional regulator
VARRRARASPPSVSVSRANAGSKVRGDGTRERLLAAATEEFASKGHGGARIDAICTAARANPRMVYHYFGDKDRLYVAVLSQVLNELRSEELKLAVDPTAPMRGLLELFRFVNDHFGRHPEIIHLLSGENMLGGRFIRRSIKTAIAASPLIALISELLARGRRQGIFRRGIDPLRLYVMMVALSYFHRSNAATLSVIFGTDVSASDWQRRYRKDGEAMLQRYLSADRKSTPTRSRKHSSNSK